MKVVNLFLGLLLLGASALDASAQSTETAEALVNEILAKHAQGRRSLPRCGVVTQGDEQFCPIISRCPEAKPFCISKSQKLRSGKRKLSCSCSAVSESGIQVKSPLSAAPQAPLQPVVCITVYAPVCGTDGKTYSNACFANANGAQVAGQGECPGSSKPLG